MLEADHLNDSVCQNTDGKLYTNHAMVAETSGALLSVMRPGSMCIFVNLKTFLSLLSC